MKIAISNLAFPNEGRERTYARLAAAGAQGVEIAPTRLQPWSEMSASAGRQERARLGDAGLMPSSLQAIFYGRPELQLLADEAAFQAMSDHLARLAEYAQALEVTTAVFGAPAHRNRNGLDVDEANDLGAARLVSLGRRLEGSGLALGMEPIPPAYRGDFLTTYAEAAAMVRRVDHQAIRLHLDTGCVLLGGDDIARAIEECADLLVHFQAAEPNLGGFDAPIAKHAEAAQKLAAVGYGGWVAIEMLEDSPDPAAGAEKAVSYAADLYGRGVKEKK